MVLTLLTQVEVFEGSVASDRLGSGTIAKARLPFTISTTAPTGVGSI